MKHENNRDIHYRLSKLRDERCLYSHPNRYLNINHLRENEHDDDDDNYLTRCCHKMAMI
jgi:hypothetical protein